jgi:histidinol-phosphate phosphatase family protein
VPQAAVFLDRDGTINTHIGHVSRAAQLELIPGAGEAIRRLNDSDYRAVVVTNQPVVARGDCSLEELRRIHWTLEQRLSDGGAYLDRILVCPHHPNRGFAGEVAALKFHCDCRKPNTGLIDRAVAELNIARDASWMVGDSSSDMLAAHRAGLKSILVETGEAGLDARFASAPDFVAPDLAAAVDFILDEYPGLAALSDGLAASLLSGDLVFIGGLSRSGKTTLATALRFALKRQARRALVLGADRWLLDVDDRGPGVLGRYNVDEIARVVASLSDRGGNVDLSLPIYDRLARRRRDEVEPIRISRDDVVIFEGTVVLKVASQLQHWRNLYYMETDEVLRKSRVLREYRLRGYTRKEAEAVYAARQLDETPTIVATAAIAQRIALPLSDSKAEVGYVSASSGAAR